MRKGNNIKKEWMGCVLADLRAFGINADQRTTECSPGRGECRKTAEQGKERFKAKWIVAQKSRAGLRYAVVVVKYSRT